MRNSPLTTLKNSTNQINDKLGLSLGSDSSALINTNKSWFQPQFNSEKTSTLLEHANQASPLKNNSAAPYDQEALNFSDACDRCYTTVYEDPKRIKQLQKQAEVRKTEASKFLDQPRVCISENNICAIFQDIFNNDEPALQKKLVAKLPELLDNNAEWSDDCIKGIYDLIIMSDIAPRDQDLKVLKSSLVLYSRLNTYREAFKSGRVPVITLRQFTLITALPNLWRDNPDWQAEERNEFHTIIEKFIMDPLINVENGDDNLKKRVAALHQYWITFQAPQANNYANVQVNDTTS